MESAIRTQEQLHPLQQFSCPSCGNALSIVHPRAQEIACQYCGSVLDARSETHQILKSLGDPGRHQPKSFIRLGMTGEFDGRLYQVLARTRWRMDYQEYYTDEDGSGYSSEVWIYDEWLLMDQRRTYLYLVEDDEGYALSEEIVPETPMLLDDHRRMGFFRSHGRSIVREYGDAQALFFEGESNYRIQTGDQIQFASYKHGGIDYIAESRLHPETGEPTEVEFFRERPLSRQQILEAFDTQASVQEIKESYHRWGFIGQAAWVSALAMGVLLLMAMFSDGKSLWKETLEVRPESMNRSYGPFKAEAPGLYRLNMRAAGLANNSEFPVLAYILNESGEPVNVLQGNFSYYSGVDDEGSWTETDDQASITFRLRQPGEYAIRLYWESANASQIEVSLRNGIMLTRWYLIAGLLFAAAGVYAHVKRSQLF